MMLRVALALVGLVGVAAAEPDWGPKRAAFDPQVIARYEAILVANPFDEAALAHLDALFVGAHPTAELEARLASPVARARLRVRHRDLRGARDLLEGSDEPRVWILCAKLDRDLGDPDAERADYQHALALSPPAPIAKQALQMLAERAALDRDPDADRYFVQWLALVPDDPQIWLERGDALADPVLAIESYARAEALTRDPAKKLVAITGRGDAEARAHRPAEAIATFERALMIAPHDYFIVGELYGRLVDTAREAKLLPELRADLEARWPATRRDAQQWATLAQILFGMGDEDRGVLALARATALAPWDLPSQHQLIALYDKRGDREAARKQLVAAVRAAPGEAELQLQLAEHEWLRDSPQAIAQLARTAAQWPDDINVLQAVSGQLVAHALAARAERSLEHVARLEPDDSDHWLALVDAYLAAGDVKGAVAAWHRVAHEMPGAMLTCAERLLGAGAMPEATEMIEASLAIDLLNPEAYRLRSLVYEQANMPEDAIADGLRALELTSPIDPDLRRRARHHLVSLVAAQRDQHDPAIASLIFRHYADFWHDALYANPPDVEAGYLYIELMELRDCEDMFYGSCTGLREAAHRLETLAPGDPEPLRLEIRLLEHEKLRRAVAERLRRLAKLDPAHAAQYLERADRFDDSIAALLEAPAPRGSVAHAPDTARTCNGDHACPADLHAGLAMNASSALRGDRASPALGVGAYLEYQLAHPEGEPSLSVELRGELAQSAHVDGALAVFGWYNLEWATAVRIGAGTRVLFSDQVGLSIDGNLAFGLRDAPIDIGARFEQFVVGTADTRGLLELKLRLF